LKLFFRVDGDSVVRIFVGIDANRSLRLGEVS